MEKMTTTTSVSLPLPLVLLVVAAVFISGCMPIWQARELEEDLAQMETRQGELEREAREREQELAEMIEEAQAEIDELEEVLEEARELLRRDSAELGADVNEARREVGRLRGEIEALEFQYDRLEQNFQTFRTDFDRLFEGVEPEELLEKAIEFREDHEHDLARRALQRFVEDYPDHELAPEARLELGDVYFDLEMWANAGRMYGQVQNDTTSEARRARATRRVGEVFMMRGECGEAELFLEAVVEDYPGSQEVQKAQERLDQLQRGDCPPP